MAEKVLPYNRAHVKQQTGWWCGPAAVQTVMQSRGKLIPEDQIAAAIEQIENPGRGDDRDGTDYVGLIETYLDRIAPEAKFTSVYMVNDPPTARQKDRLWRDLTRSIDAGWGVVANIVAPPRNPPAATKGSKPPPYPNWLTTYHYIALMGYDDNPANRAVWVADSAAFGGITGWWCPFDGKGSIASLIPPKGYCYADVAPAPVPAPAPQSPEPEPAPTPVAVTHQRDWDQLWQTHIEWLAFTYADPKAIEEIIARARNNDARSLVALARLEAVNPDALQAYITATKG